MNKCRPSPMVWIVKDVRLMALLDCWFYPCCIHHAVPLPVQSGWTCLANIGHLLSFFCIWPLLCVTCVSCPELSVSVVVVQWGFLPWTAVQRQNWLPLFFECQKGCMQVGTVDLSLGHPFTDTYFSSCRSGFSDVASLNIFCFSSEIGNCGVYVLVELPTFIHNGQQLFFYLCVPTLTFYLL